MFTLAVLITLAAMVDGIWVLTLDPLPGDRNPAPPTGWNWKDYEIHILKTKKIMYIAFFVLIGIDLAVIINL